MVISSPKSAKDLAAISQLVKKSKARTTVPAVSERVTEYTLNALPDDICVDYYAWEVKVVYRGKDRWAVTHVGSCLGRDGKWDYEHSPSNRTDSWLDKHRFGEQEALQLAREVAPTIVVNGYTVEAILAKYNKKD